MLIAIHEVQDQMNIAGATEAEAMGTIEGSIGMLQGAWQNLLTGLGDSEADLGGLIDNVVTSALAVVDNIVPVAEQAMNGIAQLIDGIAPVLEENLPNLINTVLPSLLSAITSIISAVASALPTIAGVLLPEISNIIQRTLPSILSLVPQFISIGGELIRGVITGLVENASEITQAGLDVLQTLIDGFAEATSGDGIAQLVDTTMQIVEMIGTFLVENAPTLITAAVQLITQLAMLLTDPSNLQMLIDMSLQLILAVADGLVQSAPMLANAVVSVIGNLLMALWNELPNILSTIAQLLGDVIVLVIGLVGGLMGQSFDEVQNGIVEVGSFIQEKFSEFITNVANFGADIIEKVVNLWMDIGTSFLDGISSVGEALSGWWDELTTFGSDIASAALTWAGDMIDNFVSGIRNGIGAVGDAVSSIADTVAGYIGFSEPEDPRSALHNFHTFAPDMIDLWNTSLEGAMPELSMGMGSMADYIADSMPSLEGAGDMAGVVSMPPIVVQAYFGQEKIDEIMVESDQRIDFISGGRA
jgi:phage-related protein